jgi:hypothetical protein
MENFIKKAVIKKIDSNTKRYFLRFGKGDYKGRFLISLDIGPSKIKVRSSYELANDFVRFVNELNKDLKFSGKILTKDKIAGKAGRKKAGVIVYEVEECSINEFENAYYYLLDVNNEDVLLKIKKGLPKPGQDESKIDEKFCALDLNLKYLNNIKETFFWDVPECKKAVIEHEIIINQIEFPKGEKDPVKIRENAIRKGKIIRKINADGKEIIKEYELEV